MDERIFWEVIGRYNQETWILQVILTILVFFSFILLTKRKLSWLPKITLGIASIFIGVVFFLYYGTEPIQHYFAAPLFVFIGALFIFEGSAYRNDEFINFGVFQWAFFLLVILYPVISYLSGHLFPRMTLYIMPCPLISISIVVYSGYKRKNKFLLALLALWGMTGVKSCFFNVWEDVILLVAGIYSIFLLFSEYKKGQPIKPCS